MDTYKIFVNGSQQGSIKCENIETYIKETHPNVKHRISHENQMVHLSVDILDLMCVAAKEDLI